MKNDIDTSIGIRLTHHRSARGLDVPTLATAIGCSPYRLLQIEQGAHVSASEVMALCRALRIAPQDLLGGITADTPAMRAAADASTAADGLRLNAAFVRLSAKHRAFLIDLAEQLADAPEPDDLSSTDQR